MPAVTATALPREMVTPVAATRTSSPRLLNEKVPVSDWPPKAIVAPVATSSTTGAAVVNRTTTGAAPPGISSVSSMTRPVVLTRAATVPVRVTPGMPTRLTVPEALSAQVDPILTRPMRPSVSRTPTASGLVSPVESLAGPRPRKIVSPSPAKTWAAWPPIVVSLKVMLPSIVSTSAIVRLRFDSETSKTLPAANFTDRVRPPTSMEVSTGPVVVLTRSRMSAPAPTGPAAMVTLPVRYPATPPVRRTNAPWPSTRRAPSPPTVTSTDTSVAATTVTALPSPAVP